MWAVNIARTSCPQRTPACGDRTPALVVVVVEVVLLTDVVVVVVDDGLGLIPVGVARRLVLGPIQGQTWAARS